MPVDAPGRRTLLRNLDPQLERSQPPRHLNILQSHTTHYISSLCKCCNNHAVQVQRQARLLSSIACTCCAEKQKNFRTLRVREWPRHCGLTWQATFRCRARSRKRSVVPFADPRTVVNDSRPQPIKVTATHHASRRHGRCGSFILLNHW